MRRARTRAGPARHAQPHRGALPACGRCAGLRRSAVARPARARRTEDRGPRAPVVRQQHAAEARQPVLQQVGGDAAHALAIRGQRDCGRAASQRSARTTQSAEHAPRSAWSQMMRSASVRRHSSCAPTGLRCSASAVGGAAIAPPRTRTRGSYLAPPRARGTRIRTDAQARRGVAQVRDGAHALPHRRRSLSFWAVPRRSAGCCDCVRDGGE